MAWTTPTNVAHKEAATIGKWNNEVVANLIHLHQGNHIEVLSLTHSGAGSVWDLPGANTLQKLLLTFWDGACLDPAWVDWSVGGSSVTINGTGLSNIPLIDGHADLDYGSMWILCVIEE